MTDTDQKDEGIQSGFWQADLTYAITLFAIAAIALGYAINSVGFLAGDYGWGTALFFIAFGLFTITMGFPHPGFGHVSFDRVAQVACILVLGPIDAAWINGLASLIYPWHRLAKGIPARTVLTASLNNAGLMSLTILVCGLLYEQVGGPVPLLELNFLNAGLLLLLALSMQLVNDIGMMVLLQLRGLKPSSLLNVFTTGVELVSVLIAVLFAVAFTSFGSNYYVLLLVVMSIGMLILRKYALMRQRLEALVDERTEELRLKSIELERQATHDKLTGLFNRRYADDYMLRQVEISRRHDRQFTIALADIDHFKRINDRFSHGVGDEVLRRVAAILRDRCRKTDIVARYGGEEFLLCFPDTDSEFAEQICSQIRIAVENANWSDVDARIGENMKITMSFGIAALSSDARLTTILNDADTRLYQAKNKGRNRVVS